MKKIIFYTMLMGTFFFAKSQATLSEIFSGDNIVWYGLDFTNSRFIGQFDQAVGAGPASAYDIKTKHIPSWNSLILSESTKYDIGKTFRKTSVYNDISPVEKVNAKIDEDKLMSYNTYSFSDAQSTVSNCVKKYSGGDQSSGLAVVFIVEYFHKDQQEASVYVTFFDIASKNVLFSEKIIGKAKGIGLRNYWGGAIYSVLTQIQKTEYAAWKKKYL